MAARHLLLGTHGLLCLLSLLLATGGARAALDPPAAPGTYDLVLVSGGPAYDINGRGWVVGATDPYQGQAYLWKEGQLQSLLPPQAEEALAFGVNDSGVVALYGIFDSDPIGRAFSWSENGGFQALGLAPDQSWAEAWDVNDQGHVVGFVEDQSGYPMASIWVDGVWTDVGGVTAPASSWAFGINDAGQVVGFVAEGPARACFFDGGAQTLPGVGDYSSAYAVNDLGHVVGRTRLGPGNFQLWIYSDGGYTTIANGSYVEVTDVNNRGQVVGTVEQNAFLWQDGVLYDLNALVAGSPGLRIAHGINDCGMIVGETDGGLGFLLVPTTHDPTDTDGDGLGDVWEICGIDANFDGTLDLFLPGADPERKDLFVELDAMTGHVPSATALGMVVEAFAAAPVDNPDDSEGISLHFVGGADPDDVSAACDPCIDEADLADAAWPDAWASFFALKVNRFGSPRERSHANSAAVLEAKALAFRYGISAQSFTSAINGATTASGNAEIAGNDFYVTVEAALGARPVTDEAMAGTLMHEIGHTLGLGHGGDQEGPVYAFKPNYHSVMNYLWQMPLPDHDRGPGSVSDRALANMRRSWRLDYSRGTMNDLDENALDEAAGLGGDASLHTLVGSIAWKNGDPRLIRMGGRIDWNYDGDTMDSGVQSDLNFFVDVNDTLSLDVLTCPDDWSSIVLLPNQSAMWQNGQIPLPRAANAQTEDPVELDAEMLDAFASLRMDCDGNGVYDDLEIEQGLVADADLNGIPDACEGTVAVTVGPGSSTFGGLQAGSATPNPTSSSTTLAFVLLRTADVDVLVVDVAGRVVRHLGAGIRGEGPHVVRWDGRDEGGSPAASGVYFLHLRAADESVSRKVVLRR